MYRHIHLSTEFEEWLEGLTNQTFISNFAASSSAACRKVAEDGVAQAHPYRVCAVLNPLCSAQGSRGIISSFCKGALPSKLDATWDKQVVRFMRCLAAFETPC